MTRQTQPLQALLQKYLNNTITPSELKLFFEAVAAAAHEDQIHDEVGALWDKLPGSKGAAATEDSAAVYDYATAAKQIIQQAEVQEWEASLPIPMYKKAWFRYAAAVVLFVALGVYFYRYNGNDAAPPSIAAHDSGRNDIQPGGQKAVLVLADGSTITLDDAGNGQLAIENGTEITKKDGQVVYGNSENTAVTYNTMSTPRGGQYSITLPDGTKVWLNAESSITFPTHFNGPVREIAVKGEVYLEVARNEKKPFRVDVDGRGIVEVLGTHFNVNAYTDEKNIRTTLLEGSVQVSRKGTGNASQAKLSPGQQAVMAHSAGQLKVVDGVNTAAVVAWKDGVFDFDDVSLEEAMRQLARWYDIEVVYPQSVPDVKLGGAIKRNLSFPDVLRFLGNVGLRCKLENNRKLMIYP